MAIGNLNLTTVQLAMLNDILNDIDRNALIIATEKGHSVSTYVDVARKVYEEYQDCLQEDG